MASSIDRREFLRRGAQTGAGAALLGLGLPALLAACGSDKSSAASTGTTTAAGGTPSSAGTKDLGKLDYRLSWIKNVEFGGAYIADSMGFYKAEGFSSVNLISGGPTATPAETDVATGKALVGISAPDLVAQARTKGGAKLKIIAAQYQKNPFSVMSLAAKPINKPEDMYGKKIGVQAANEVVWQAFLKAAKLDGSKINKIPAQFDPTPLTTGDVDGWFSFFTNEPNTLRTKGFNVVQFLLADFGYPLVSEVLVVTDESVKSKRPELKAFLRGEIKGWTESLKDPAKAATLAATVYGKDLGLDATEQTLESKSQNTVLLTSDTKANGLFTVTPTLIEENIKTLAIADITVTATDLFDMSILAEVYKEDPSLISALSAIPLPDKVG